MPERAGGEEGGEKPLLTPGLYDNLICVWWLRVWKALCPIRSVQQISTCPWQRWSGSFRRRCGTEPEKRAQTLQVEQAEINEHHKPHLFNTRWHRMNIPSVKLFCTIFQLLIQNAQPRQRPNKNSLLSWWRVNSNSKRRYLKCLKGAGLCWMWSFIYPSTALNLGVTQILFSHS